MKGVTFGTIHSWNDLSLILSAKSIETPTAKTKRVEIEGSDGALDMTEYFGEVKYNNRGLAFNFTSISPRSQLLSVYSNVQDALHGKKVKVILDDDPNYYYYGRIDVSSFAINRNVGTFEITVDAEPYKYEISETVVSETVDSEKTIQLSNSRKSVVPKITVTGEVNVVFGEYSATLSTGTYTIPEFTLKSGNNTFTISGNGTIQFVYRKGRL